MNKVTMVDPLSLLKKIMVQVSRNQALCMFLQLKFTPENVTIAQERSSSLSNKHDGVNVFFLKDPLVSVLYLKSRIHGNTFLPRNS
jgi:hypothetical protein